MSHFGDFCRVFGCFNFSSSPATVHENLRMELAGEKTNGTRRLYSIGTQCNKDSEVPSHQQQGFAHAGAVECDMGVKDGLFKVCPPCQAQVLPSHLGKVCKPSHSFVIRNQ